MRRTVITLIVGVCILIVSGGNTLAAPPDIAGTWTGTLYTGNNPKVDAILTLTKSMTKRNSFQGLASYCTPSPCAPLFDTMATLIVEFVNVNTRFFVLYPRQETTDTCEQGAFSITGTVNTDPNDEIIITGSGRDTDCRISPFTGIFSDH